MDDSTALSVASIVVTVVLGGISIVQATRAARSAKLAEERSQQSLDATRDGLANSDENTRRQIAAMEKMLREFMDDPRQPRFGGPVQDEKGQYTGGNVKHGYTQARASITAHADTHQPTVVAEQNPAPPKSSAG